jgi:hypothetical protein
MSAFDPLQTLEIELNWASMMMALFLVGGLLIAWSLAHGMRTGTMELPWIPFASFRRAEQPIMFWIAAGLCFAIAIGCLLFGIGAGLQSD